MTEETEKAIRRLWDGLASSMRLICGNVFPHITDEVVYEHYSDCLGKAVKIFTHDDETNAWLFFYKTHCIKECDNS